MPGIEYCTPKIGVLAVRVTNRMNCVVLFVRASRGRGGTFPGHWPETGGLISN